MPPFLAEESPEICQPVADRSILFAVPPFRKILSHPADIVDHVLAVYLVCINLRAALSESVEVFVYATIVAFALSSVGDS